MYQTLIKNRRENKRIFDDVIGDRACTRAIRMANLLKNSTLRKILLISQIKGMETYLLRTYVKTLVELPQFSYKKIKRPFDNVKNVIYGTIGENIMPRLVQVFRFNSIKLNL